jgi:hypothetical protein
VGIFGDKKAGQAMLSRDFQAEVDLPREALLERIIREVGPGEARRTGMGNLHISYQSEQLVVFTMGRLNNTTWNIAVDLEELGPGRTGVHAYVSACQSGDAVRFIHETMPPVFEGVERACS